MAGATEDTVIEVSRLSKDFVLPHEKTTSIKAAVINAYHRKRSFEIQHALKNISLQVKKGEFFGIIGRNGSGKSTLLKLLAGIYVPTSGEVEVNGALTPFIELGVGFNPELTGRENVYLNGALLGFTRKEMRAMYQDIVEFAELERFMDQKLKNYSSGMHVRLAFSIAVRAQSDILLIDEVLAVGDMAFQEKCYRVFDKIKESGRTVVFISHDSSAIQRFCDRVAIIDAGQLIAVGKPKPMVLRYGALVAAGQYGDEAKTQGRIQREGTGEATILSVDLLDKQGASKSSIDFGEPFSIELSYKTRKKIDHNVVVGVDIIDDQGISILGPNSREAGQKVRLGDKGEIKLDFDSNPLSPKTYSITVGIFNEEETFAYDLVEHVKHFKVLGSGRHGKIYIEPKWRVGKT